MGAKAWQYVGAGISVPLMGWALTDIFEGNNWIAYAAFPFAIGLGAICLIGIILAGRRAARVRDGLARFIAECEALMKAATREGEPLPEAEVNDWWARLQAFISKELSEAHLVRLNSSPPNSLMIAGKLTKEQQNYWSWLHNRCERLHEFIREASSER